MSKRIKQLIFLAIGIITFTLGCLGIVLPILPTVPFFLVAAFCFARSSQKLHSWFIGTDLYKKNLESFVKKRGMSPRTKFIIIINTTLIMGLSFFLMNNSPIGRTVISVMWVFHLIYFIFGVKTIRVIRTQVTVDKVNEASSYQKD